MSFDRVLAYCGLILAILIVVLDKAGKVRGPIIFVLLAFAAGMTVPLFLSIPWVANAPIGMPVLARRWFMVCVVLTIYSGIAVWISTPGRGETEGSISSRPALPNTFAVDIRSAAVSDSGPLTAFMVRYQSLFGDTVSPVFYLTYVQISNVSHFPNGITTIRISASKDAEGPWQDLTVISMLDKRLYFVGYRKPENRKSVRVGRLLMSNGTFRLATPPTKDDMKYAVLISAIPDLERQLSSPIASGGVIRGWVALDSLRHEGLSPGKIYFRLELRDLTQIQEVHILQLPRMEPGQSSLESDTGMIQSVGVLDDISTCYLRYHSDPYPPPIAKAP